jgi:hypothetical protein
MLHKCRAESFDMVEIAGRWLYRPGLSRIVDPYHRTLPSWTYDYKATNPKLSSTLRGPGI